MHLMADMSRNYSNLRVFVLADALVIDVYVASRQLPDEERFGLQSQLRRAATSVATNIVEGSTRRTDRAYLTFLETSLGSASEAGYLLTVAARVGALRGELCAPLVERYASLVRQLEALITKISSSLPTTPVRRAVPKAESRKPRADR
jgi:four helix bundle protein